MTLVDAQKVKAAATIINSGLLPTRAVMHPEGDGTGQTTIADVISVAAAVEIVAQCSLTSESKGVGFESNSQR